MNLPPSGISGHCFIALGYLLSASNAEVRAWVYINRGVKLTPGQAGGSLYGLAHTQLPLAEMTERNPSGRGQPGTWQLTKRGRAVFLDEYNRSMKDWRVTR